MGITPIPQESAVPEVNAGGSAPIPPDTSGPGSSFHRAARWSGWLVAAVGLGLIGRILLIALAPQHGYWPDHDDFVRWGILAHDRGLTALYTTPAPRHTVVVYHPDGTTSTGQRSVDRTFSYGPAAAYIIRAEGWLHAQLDSERLVNTPASRRVYSSLSIFIDLLMALGCAAVVAAGFEGRAARDAAEGTRRRRAKHIALAAAFLAPPMAVVGSLWGQTDGILMAAVVWMLWAMMRRRWMVAGLLWGLAVAIKPQGLVLAPIWLYAFVIHRGRFRILFGAVLAVGFLNLLAIPFWQTSGWAWMERGFLDHISTTRAPAGRGTYSTTMGRYNLWMLDALFGGNTDARTVVWGLSKLAWGQLACGLFALTGFVAARLRWGRLPFGLCVATACLLTALVAFPTGVHGRHLVMAVPLMICVAVHARPAWWAAIPFAIGGGFEIPRDFWREPPAFVEKSESQPPGTSLRALGAQRLKMQEAREAHEERLALHSKLRPQREIVLSAVMSLAPIILIMTVMGFDPRRHGWNTTTRLDVGSPRSPPRAGDTLVSYTLKPESFDTTAAAAGPDSSPAGWRGVVRVGVAIIAIKTVMICWGVYQARETVLDKGNYEGNYHHHEAIGRYEDPPRHDFFELWVASDAQWYLAIADQGYPDLLAKRESKPASKPKLISETDTHLKYVFFPLWPITIAATRLFLSDLYVSGFVASNLISLAAMLVLYVFLRGKSGHRSAFWTVVMLAASPFAMFYSVPFTESLFLLLAVLTFVATESRQWLRAGVFIGLAAVTRPNGAVLLCVPFVYFIVEAFRKKEWSWKDFSKLERLSVAILPLFAYLLVNKARTGDSLFFSKAIGWWGYEGKMSIQNLLDVTGRTFEQFENLPWHSFHSSQLDFIVLLASAILLITGLRVLPAHFSAYAMAILLLPLLTKDLMSYSRYVVVAWPLYYGAVMTVRGRYRRWVFGILVPILLIGQMLNMARFVNWYWVG